MGFLDAIVSTAKSLLEDSPDAQNTIYSRRLTDDERFRKRHNLPEPETLMAEANAVVGILPAGQTLKSLAFEDLYHGNLVLSESFIVFECDGEPRALQFALPLAAVRRVDRLPSGQMFALRIQLYEDISIIVQLEDIKSNCDRFAGVLSGNLKANVPLAKQLRLIFSTFYSEFLVESIKRKRNHEANQEPLVPPPAGLGRDFGYPGDAKKLRDRAKMRLWVEYMSTHGRNIALVRQQGFFKLVRVGLPNHLRGELWELCCGSVHLRMKSASLYRSILDQQHGQQSLAIEEIEKDLNRSLPEYPAYQDPEGISRLRRVLTAYSWMCPDVGYCQAMNIVAAGLLIYQTEEQAFWTLHKLTQDILPGYYSRTMYGTLLDQKVLECLVERTMPVLWSHLQQCDVPLSVVSLPWFLSLFINTMPIVYAFRIIDILFLEGSRTLFQVALAILRVNGEALLNAEDNTAVIAVLKNYFDVLGMPAHPRADSERLRRVTRFQELMVVAYKEFSVVTDDMILSYRRKYESQVLDDIEDFAKRTQLRNVLRPRNLNRDEIGVIYDKFYAAIQATRPGLGGQSGELSFPQFITFMSGLVDWMQPKYVARGELENHKFVRRLFNRWDSRNQGSLCLGDAIGGLDCLVDPDMMELINYFFECFIDIDTDADTPKESRANTPTKPASIKSVHSRTPSLSPSAHLPKLGHGAILEMADALLLLVRPFTHKGSTGSEMLDPVSIAALNQVADDPAVPAMRDMLEQQQSVRYLGAVSNFIQRTFEVANLKPVNAGIDGEVTPSLDLIDLPDTKSEAQGLSLPHLRMVLLADETLELLFSTTLRSTIHLTDQGTGLLGQPTSVASFRSMVDGVVRDGLRLADGLRKRIDELDKERPDEEIDDMDVRADDRALLDL